MQPKVSIIVPVYNTQDTLERCLDSLVDQTLDAIEILVINDGTPDDSQKIIDLYVQNYPEKIKAFIKPNGGLSDARNYGIERAQGEYLAFVDSDDYVDLDCYERMIRRAEEDDADVVSSPVTYVQERSIHKRLFNRKRFGQKAEEDPYILIKANSFAWNKIYRKSFWDAYAFRFAKQWFEDSQLIYNVLLVANKVSCVNIPFYHYVKVREDSITNTVDERIFDIFKSTDSIISFYKAQGKFEKLYDTVEFLCLRHLFGRVDTIHKVGDKEVGLRFVEKMLGYLQQYFPNWRESEYVTPKEDSTSLRRYRCRVLTDVELLKDYAQGSSARYEEGYEKAANDDQNAKLDLITEEFGSPEKKSEKENAKKRKKIQKKGLRTIADIQNALQKYGIQSFADFGTCLGIVREGKLLAHDLDIDIGVIADSGQQRYVRMALERLGYELWRQYVYDDYAVEESYRFENLKVDLNFYKITDEYSKTWLFYRKPGQAYENNERHIVEMTYRPITGFRQVEVEGVPITIPDCAEELLEEKYGPGWRTPDTGWIYWESPAARKLDTIGHYIYCEYMDHKRRTREVPDPVLFIEQELGKLDWNTIYDFAYQGYDPCVICETKKSKSQCRHPRVRTYLRDPENPDFVMKIKKRVSGIFPLKVYGKDGKIYTIG